MEHLTRIQVFLRVFFHCNTLFHTIFPQDLLFLQIFWPLPWHKHFEESEIEMKIYIYKYQVVFMNKIDFKKFLLVDLGRLGQGLVWILSLSMDQLKFLPVDNPEQKSNKNMYLLFRFKINFVKPLSFKRLKKKSNYPKTAGQICSIAHGRFFVLESK